MNKALIDATFKRRKKYEIHYKPYPASPPRVGVFVFISSEANGVNVSIPPAEGVFQFRRHMILDAKAVPMETECYVDEYIDEGV